MTSPLFKFPGRFSLCFIKSANFQFVCSDPAFTSIQSGKSFNLSCDACKTWFRLPTENFTSIKLLWRQELAWRHKHKTSKSESKIWAAWPDPLNVAWLQLYRRRVHYLRLTEVCKRAEFRTRSLRLPPNRDKFALHFVLVAPAAAYSPSDIYYWIIV